MEIQQTQKYCRECGKSISQEAEVCPNCGVRQQIPSDNKWITTLLLCWFLGFLGVHRFYTGHTAIGVVQLLTFGGCFIWSFIDLILIIVGEFKDAEGNPIKNK